MVLCIAQIRHYRSASKYLCFTLYTGFNGAVYCTDPTLQIGKLYMKELVTYIERVSRTKTCNLWKKDDILKNLPLPLRDAVTPIAWQKCYTVFGALTVMCCSSGYSLGSCNWIIHSDYEKICYVSATSTLTTHPKPIDQAPLRHSNVMIFSSLTQTPLTNPDSMIGEFCVNAAVTIKNGGNVLVPCNPSGVTYDLFECLSGHLDSCGLSTVPLYFISPVADSTLAYSNIFGECLGRLKHFNNIHDLQQDFKCPCIVFTGHPSLRLGDAIHFIELWGKSATNTIIFTEPDYPYLDALGPFQPLQMRVCYCPIDTSLSFSQANKLIRDLRPQHLVVPETYITPPPSVTQRPDLELSPITYKQGEVITLPVKRKYECIEIDPKLASSLDPVEIKPGSAVSMVNASLVVKDNKYILEPLPPADVEGKPFKPRPYIYGSLNTKAFVDTLSKQGISDIKVEDRDEGCIIHLVVKSAKIQKCQTDREIIYFCRFQPKEDILIQVEQGSTHIMCGGDETLRIKIRDSLLQCLQKL
ncbi:INT9-like protein [Mya arenaria]|uniref:INT9-like protein n=1 Tax=Mya arenaria TaxID=6604 RepID=A0ABY7EP42_MYAAR|nr:INT9-like protein [Mya arenaria]